ncbi:MAG: hypothetical protein GY696_11050 [Gammaproteobacteria bacterium]|nr:hypothetical protein [Gammaproteobacteria bacterium]
MLEDQGRLRCPGEGHGPRGQPAPPDHFLMELQIKIQFKHLVASLGQVSSEDNGLRLPCLVRENGCRTLHKTYVWPGETGNCKLKYIRTITPNRTQDTWLVDHNHKLLLNLTGVYPVPDCRIVLESTQLRNLYLANLTIPELCQVVQDLPQVSSKEINVQRETGAALAYATYRLHQQIEAANHVARAQICHQQWGILENRPVQVQPGRFGLTNGDLYYQYNFRAQTPKIWELPECWTYVPIKGGGFVDPHSRLFTLHSSKVACNHFFPLTVQTQEGWVAIMPHLVWQPEPNHLPAQRKSENIQVGRTARGLASWTESQDWQDRFWWPLQ